MKLFYNSSTGNSLYVAKKISNSFNNCKVISMVNAIKSEDFDLRDEKCIGFIYPIHCGSLPVVVREFISKVEISDDAYVFCVAVTGGSGAELSFKHVSELLDGQCNINNSLTVKYISNYLRAGRNPSEERMDIALRKNEVIIDSFIKELKDKKAINKKYKGIIQSIMYKLWLNNYKNKDKNFNCNNSCIGCSICEKVCPVDNIKLQNNKPIWLGKCVDCMACINLCPEKAINIGSKTVKKNRFKNPNIDIKELM